MAQPMKPETRADKKKRRLLALSVGLFLFAVYLLSYRGGFHSVDEVSIFATTESIIKFGRFNTDQIAWTQWATTQAEAQGFFGRGGHVYSKKGLGLSLAQAPLYGLALILPHIGMLQTVSLLNALITAATGLLLFMFVHRLEFSLATAIGTALIYGLATIAFVYAKYLFSEPLAGFSLLLAAYLLFVYRYEGGLRHLAIAGLTAGFAVLTRANNLFLLPVFGLYLLWIIRARLKEQPPDDAAQPSAINPLKEPNRIRDTATSKENKFHSPIRHSLFAHSPIRLFSREFIGPAAVFVIAVALMGLILLAYNAIRSGDALQTGYDLTLFSPNILLGLYKLLFSPLRGFFIYSPILLLSLPGWWHLRKTYPAEAWLFAGLAGVTLALFSAWSSGEGLSWGSRFLVPIVPFFVICLAPILGSKEYGRQAGSKEYGVGSKNPEKTALQTQNHSPSQTTPHTKYQSKTSQEDTPRSPLPTPHSPLPTPHSPAPPPLRSSAPLPLRSSAPPLPALRSSLLALRSPLLALSFLIQLLGIIINPWVFLARLQADFGGEFFLENTAALYDFRYSQIAGQLQTWSLSNSDLAWWQPWGFDGWAFGLSLALVLWSGWLLWTHWTGAPRRLADEAENRHGPARFRPQTGTAWLLLSIPLTIVLTYLLLARYFVTDRQFGSPDDGYIQALDQVVAQASPADKIVTVAQYHYHVPMNRFKARLPIIGFAQQTWPVPETALPLLKSATSGPNTWLITIGFLPAALDNATEQWLAVNAFKATDTWFDNEVRLVRFSTAQPTTTRPIDTTLGHDLRLVAVTLTPTLQPAQTLPVELTWQPLRQPQTDYNLFLQLLAPDGTLVAQHDNPPGDGYTPTSTWQPGHQILDRHALVLPPDLPPNHYRLIAGLYDPQTGQRLPISPTADFVELGTINITHP